MNPWILKRRINRWEWLSDKILSNEKTVAQRSILFSIRPQTDQHTSKIKYGCLVVFAYARACVMNVRSDFDDRANAITNFKKINNWWKKKFGRLVLTNRRRRETVSQRERERKKYWTKIEAKVLKSFKKADRSDEKEEQEQERDTNARTINQQKREEKEMTLTSEMYNTKSD